MPGADRSGPAGGGTSIGSGSGAKGSFDVICRFSGASAESPTTQCLIERTASLTFSPACLSSPAARSANPSA